MIALLALALAVASLQQPAPAAASPDDVVRVDAFITDARGRQFQNPPTAADLELREDGVLQKIETVRIVRAGAQLPASDPVLPIATDADEQREASRGDARLIAIYLDEYHLDPAAADRVREPLLRFVDRELEPRDLLLVMKPLDSLFTIRLALDREAARQAIASLVGRKGDYAPAGKYEREYMAGAPAAIDATRTQVTMSALNALAVHLGWVSPDARKTLMVVSEGFGAPSDRRRGLNLPTLASIIQSANRANVSVYGLDPNGASADDSKNDALGRVVSETDGLSIAGADLETGLRRIASESGAYYLITYRSAGKIDNKFHAIELRSKKTGVKVRTRAGYWAVSPDDLLRASLLDAVKNPPAPKPLEPAPRTSRLISPWFGISRGDDGLMRVTFVWEAVRGIPGERSRAAAPARLQFIATAANGSAPYEATVLPVGSTIPINEEASNRAVFEVPPGRVRIRMSIEDAGAQEIDSDVRDISVRDLRSGVVLGTPEVLRARNAREFRELDADPEAVPVATRVFSRTERLVIRVPAYAPDGQPVVSATLMSRARQPMRSLAVTRPAGSDAVNQIDLPLAGLASSDYMIEFSVTNAAGDAKETLGFRVTP